MAATGIWQSHGSTVARPNIEAFLSYGFRPFFLGSAAYAVLLMAVWIAWATATSRGFSGDWLPIAGSPYAWHAHELVFGFAGAAIAGFLLTAVPNWTGALPISGPPLGLLFGIWMAGRLVMIASGILASWIPAAVDLAFLPALASVAARQLFVKPSLRNSIFLVLLAVMVSGNALYHATASGLVDLDPLLGPHLALWTLVVMMTIIGGRVIPSFTHNWIYINAPGTPFPRRIAKLDMLAIISVAVTGLGVFFNTAPAWGGTAAIVAAAVNGVRLYLWRGMAARSEPIVWILHAGYFWIVCGLSLVAVALLTNSIALSLAYHAFGAGAAGTMILAIMTRASLGHTGRPIRASWPVVGAYSCVIGAASLRIFVPLLAPRFTAIALTLAGFAWIAAFVIFLIVYARILTTNRVHTKLSANR